jgi:hypothetical protein
MCAKGLCRVVADSSPCLEPSACGRNQLCLDGKVRTNSTHAKQNLSFSTVSFAIFRLARPTDLTDAA